MQWQKSHNASCIEHLFICTISISQRLRDPWVFPILGKHEKSQILPKMNNLLFGVQFENGSVGVLKMWEFIRHGGSHERCYQVALWVFSIQGFGVVTHIRGLVHKLSASTSSILTILSLIGFSQASQIYGRTRLNPEVPYEGCSHQ